LTYKLHLFGASGKYLAKGEEKKRKVLFLSSFLFSNPKQTLLSTAVVDSFQAEWHL
jgi:hypothetical protein